MGPMDAHGWPAPRVWVVSVQRPICQALWGGEKDEEGVGARGSHCGEGSRELTGTVGTGKGKVGEGVYHLLLVGCGGPPPPPAAVCFTTAEAAAAAEWAAEAAPARADHLPAGALPLPPPLRGGERRGAAVGVEAPLGRRPAC